MGFNNCSRLLLLKPFCLLNWVKRYLIDLSDTANELPLFQRLCRTVTLLSMPQTDCPR